MVYVNIDKDKLLESVGDVAGINKNLISNQNDFEAITKSLDSDIKDMAQINENITKISNEMFGNIDDLSKLFIFLQYAHSEYSKLDNIDSDILISEETNVSSNYLNYFLRDYLIDIVGEFGIIGSGSKILLSYLNGVSKEEDYVKIGISYLKNGSTFIKKLAGDNAIIANGASISNKVLGLIGTVYNNILEYKEGDMSSSRFVGEIVGETVVGYVTKTAITGVVGTVLVAAGVTSGAAVVIGGGLYLGLNYLWKSKYGESYTEQMSDFVLDLGEYAIQSSTNAISSLLTTVVDTKDLVTDVLGDVVDYGKNLLDDVGYAIQAFNPFTKWSFG